MTIISISRGSYNKGRVVAEKTAEKLGYQIISRDALLESSERFGIEEIKLIRDIRHASRILDRFSFGRERYIAFISSAMLNHLKNDRFVYHGLAGQFFIREISHVVKVRVIADMEVRAREESRRAGISREKAGRLLKRDDDERRKWAMFLYGIDVENPGRYDLVLNVSAMNVENAVDLIVRTARFSCFQPTPESRRRMMDLALTARVRAMLHEFPNASVSAHEGRVHITVKTPKDQEKAIRARIESAVGNVRNIKKLDLHILPYY